MLKNTLMLLGLVAIMMTGFAHAAETNAKTKEQVLKKLMGRWEIEEGMNQGEKVSEKELEGSYAMVDENVIVTYDKKKKELYRAKFTIDVSKTPFQIDMVSAMKDKPKAKALGIIKCDEDDEFVLCYALPGAERPQEFKSPQGSRIMMFEMERED